MHTEVTENPIICVVDFCFGGKKKKSIDTLHVFITNQLRNACLLHFPVSNVNAGTVCLGNYICKAVLITSILS